MKIDIKSYDNEANIQRAANMLQYATSEEVVDTLVGEGAHPETAYLLVVAGNQLLASRQENA